MRFWLEFLLADVAIAGALAIGAAIFICILELLDR